VFGLSESEQRLLVSALTGVTDEQLAEIQAVAEKRNAAACWPMCAIIPKNCGPSLASCSGRVYAQARARPLNSLAPPCGV
jgi:hypothetical protein